MVIDVMMAHGKAGRGQAFVLGQILSDAVPGAVEGELAIATGAHEVGPEP